MLLAYLAADVLKIFNEISIELTSDTVLTSRNEAHTTEELMYPTSLRILWKRRRDDITREVNVCGHISNDAAKLYNGTRFPYKIE